MLARVSHAFLWLAIAAGSRIAAACPLCAENLSNDVYQKSPTQLGRGFFWSIIFMMALPFVTVAVVAVRIVIAKKRVAASRAPGLAAVSEASP